MSFKWPLMKDTITWGDKWEMIKFIMTTNQFTNGPKVRQFENEWSKWLGCKHSLYVSSGSTANLLLLAAIKERYGLKDGDKVLVPACTWVTNIAPVIQCGFTPIFCDVNGTNYSFDPDHVLEIARKHPDIKIVFISHLLGYTADNDFYQKAFPNALILDDVCESHGCLDKDGTKIGSNSVGATFSFYFGHHMTTIEGGFVCTNDDKLYSIMRAKRSHGMAREMPPEDFEQAKKDWPEVNPLFLFITEGYNVRNHEICAVLGLSQIKRLDDQIAQRRKNFHEFNAVLRKYGNEHFYLGSDSDVNTCYAFPIVTKDKAFYTRLVDNLHAAGVETRPIVGGNLLKQPFLQAYKIEPGGKGFVNEIHEKGLYIGNNHFVGSEEMELLDSVIQKTLQNV